MSFKESGTVMDYIEVDGKKIPRYRCETEVTLTNTQTKKEYNSDKEAEDDVKDPNTATQKEHIRRDVKVTVPKMVMGSGTLKDES
tara:strand:+ start:501 stop:755 length:255 start_codon:yes stop_codon:yes gene_type:complete